MIRATEGTDAHDKDGSGMHSLQTTKMPASVTGEFAEAQSYGFVVQVVESPAPEDLLHGRTEGGVLVQTLSLVGLQCGYALAVNSGTFATAIYKTVALDIKSKPIFPIIHLSCHGTSAGIQLTSGECFEWKHLTDMFVKINKALDGKLLLCMSSCGGFAARTMARKLGDLPFLALVGNPDSASWKDCAIGFATFYHHLAKGIPLPAAVDAMRIASGDNGFCFEVGDQARQHWITEQLATLEKQLFARSQQVQQ